MKSIPKLRLWILLMIVSLKSFSQTDTDSTSIHLKKVVARLIIKDLIKGDGATKLQYLLGDKIIILEQKISLKDSIISTLNTKSSNYNSIISTQSQQLEISQQLSKKLEQHLKKQKLQTKIYKYSGGAAVLGIITLVIIK
tara:strand:+ start:2214 stop:2633 length:420 start_codon:yes stop_codon:yes gene_type:complete